MVKSNPIFRNTFAKDALQSETMFQSVRVNQVIVFLSSPAVTFYTRHKNRCLIPILALILLSLTSCIQARLEKRLQRHQASLIQDQIAIETALKQNDVKSITWEKAIELIHERNSTYKQSLNSIELAKRNQRRQWWSLAPRIGTFINVSSSLSELSNINSDSISASIFSNLNVPNPYAFHAQLYANKLQILGSELRHENNKRTVYISLYSLYRDQEIHSLEKQRFNQLLENLDKLNLEEWEVQFRNVTRLKKTIKRREHAIRQRFNTIFNTPGEGPWKIVGPVPSIDYSQQFETLKLNHNDYGKLGFMQHILEIELNALTLARAKVQRAPALNFNLDTPPLFNNNSNQSFDSDTINLFTGASKTLDLRDPLDLEKLRDTKERVTRSRQALKIQISNELIRFDQLKENYSENLQNIARIEKTLSQMTHEQLEGFSNKQFIEFSQSFHDLNKELTESRHRKKALELEFWKWDESYWKYFK